MMSVYVVKQNETIKKIFTEEYAAYLYIKLHRVEAYYSVEKHTIDVLSIDYMEKKVGELFQDELFGYGFHFDQRGNLLNRPVLQRMNIEYAFDPVNEVNESELYIVIDCEEESEEQYEASLQLARDMRIKYIKEKFKI